MVGRVSIEAEALTGLLLAGAIATADTKERKEDERFTSEEWLT